jgi:hypothetical protein
VVSSLPLNKSFVLDPTKMNIIQLNILYSAYEGTCKRLKEEIEQFSGNKESSEYLEKKKLLALRLNELNDLYAHMGKLQKETLLHSVEDIYAFSGQEDKYSVFTFYPTSESFKKYGDMVYGWLQYRKKERDALEEKIKKTPYERTDGKIILEGALQDEAKNILLKTEGFLASEVMKFHNMNHHDSREKQYGKPGTKKIPNTINIKFDPTRTDPYAMELYITGNKIKDGYKVPNHDLTSYYAVIYALDPTNIPDDVKEAYLFQEDKKTLTEEAEFKILEVKYHKKNATPEDQKRLGQLIAKRRIDRFKIIEKQLGISMKKIIEHGESNPTLFVDMYNAVMHFKTDTLTAYKTDYPIYLDFERYAHIYLKHYDKFFIPASTLKGTPFQYSYKDIRRLLTLIIENLRDKIEETLSEGKEYRKYSDQGYYFNGNYYTLRISPEGRVLQFHAQENTTENKDTPK